MKIFTISALLLIILSACQVGGSPYQQGQRIYNEKCANCHMEDGSGLGKQIPALKDRLVSLSPASQTCIIVNGVNSDSIGLIDRAMPSHKLSSVELTNLLNFINDLWANKVYKEVTVAQIKAWQNDCPSQ